MAEMAEVVDEIREGKCLLAADTQKKETDLSFDEEEEDDDYDSQDENEDEDDNDFILVEDERITRARENKAKLPPNTNLSYLSDEDDEFEQDWAIVHKQLLQTDGFHVDYLPNKHKRNWYQKIIMGCTSYKYTIEAANLAVAEYNKLQGVNLEIREIINVIIRGFDYYYLTLECTDGKYYEVQVLKMGPKVDLDMFRPAKHYPRPTTTTTTTSEEKEVEAAA
ncbi:hypothetical protein CsatB_013240 [Cannabis sativa]